MNSVVVGGGGFIGSHLCDALLAADFNVTVVDRPKARYLDRLQKRGVKLVIGDISNPSDLARAFKNNDFVFHLASATIPETSNENPIFDVESNIIGTLHLLDVARDARVKKIIFSSSGGTVYGIPKEIPIKESHPTEPISSYGVTKLAAEKFLHLYWNLYGFDYCILRISNAYGERQPVSEKQGVVAAFLDKALRQNEITIWGDGSIMRDYVYVGDIANAFIRASTYEGPSKVFNIGAGQGHSLNDVISMIESITQRSLRVRRTTSRPFDVPVNILDASLAKMHLNWQATVGLYEGITRVYEWMSKNY